MMQVDFGYDQVVHRPVELEMNLIIPGFPLTVGTFQVMPVPENKDVILGMTWLREQNLDIDWDTGRVSPRSKENYSEEAQLRLPERRPVQRIHG
ncbi:hypothetical protein CCR75_008360 [Bremia lactucae]|uniref:Uncharacterized protein n=1 Tax=Bremia lactucae TaxID=4779 RepID=A0A976FQA3_BRELC|nr:hypothetical protein CCR75_008360 [Bremia lactucae]